MKIAIVDDYQNVASSLADWDSLVAEVVVFTKAFADEAAHPADGVEDRAQAVDRSKSNKLKSDIRAGNPFTGKETA
jgi:hypothetical protein